MMRCPYLSKLDTHKQTLNIHIHIHIHIIIFGPCRILLNYRIWLLYMWIINKEKMHHSIHSLTKILFIVVTWFSFRRVIVDHTHHHQSISISFIFCFLLLVWLPMLLMMVMVRTFFIIYLSNDNDHIHINIQHTNHQY